MAVAGVDARLWEQRIAQAADHGERLLGFAMRRLPAAKARITFDDLGDGVVFLGLMGFIDPPREEAKAAIAECRSAGIAVKMITDRKSVVEGKSVSVRVDLGGRRIIKKKIE